MVCDFTQILPVALLPEIVKYILYKSMYMVCDFTQILPVALLPEIFKYIKVYVYGL